MDAFFARNRLSAYLDGELDSAEAQQVEEALARDPELRAEFERIRLAVELLRGHGVVDAPAGFAERVRERVAAEPMPSRWALPFRALRAEVWLVAAAALLVVGYVGLQDREPEPTEGSVEVAQVTPPGDAPEERILKSEPEAALPAPVEPSPREQSLAPNSQDAWSTVKNDGSLAAPATPEEPIRQSKKAAPAPEAGKQAWYPEWEQPEAQTGAAEQTLYSPAPFRYRLQSNDDQVLNQLAALAQSLDGHLEDKSGRVLSPYLMSDGDMRDVRIVVPSYNTASLAQKLRELGEVDTIVSKDTTLVKPGTPVPVQIDVRR